MLASSRFKLTSGSNPTVNLYICPRYQLISTSMLNIVFLLKRTQNVYGV